MIAQDHTASGWHLISSHGITLLYIARHPEATISEIARFTDLTQRRVSQIIRELELAGLLGITRRGRRNVYQLMAGAEVREGFLPEMNLASFLELFGYGITAPSS